MIDWDSASACASMIIASARALAWVTAERAAYSAASDCARWSAITACFSVFALYKLNLGVTNWNINTMPMVPTTTKVEIFTTKWTMVRCRSVLARIVSGSSP